MTGDDACGSAGGCGTTSCPAKARAANRGASWGLAWALFFVSMSFLLSYSKVLYQAEPKVCD